MSVTDKRSKELAPLAALDTARLPNGGDRVATGSAGAYDHVSPITGAVQGSVAMASAADVDAAVAAAKAASPGWRWMPGDRRRGIVQPVE